MKVIVIGGFPGSGKSVIMRGVIASLEQKGQVFKVQSKGSVRYMSSKDYIILGTYEPDEKFPGTDRYPMNIQPAAQTFLLEANKMYPNKTIIFEGDRLFNDKMLKFLKDNEFETVVCIVSTRRDLLEQRRNQRSEQNPSWRKGRESKVERMAIMYPISHYLPNNTKEEQDQSINKLVMEAQGAIAPIKTETKLKQLWK